MTAALSNPEQQPAALRARILLDKDLFAYAHADYLPDDLKTGLGQVLRGSRRASRRVSTMWRNEAPHFMEELPPLTERRHQLIFLSSDVLRRLLQLSGAVFCAPAFARIIDGKKRRTLEELLTPGLFSFALSKAPFLYPTTALLHREIPSLPSSDPAHLAALVNTCGQSVFEFAFASDPKSLQERLRLKFPSAYSFDFSKAAATSPVAEASALLQRLLKHEFPGVKPC